MSSIVFSLSKASNSFCLSKISCAASSNRSPSRLSTLLSSSTTTPLVSSSLILGFPKELQLLFCLIFEKLASPKAESLTLI